MKHLPSLRAYIEELKAIGEIVEIDAEVDWKLELGAIVRRSYELRAPAPLYGSGTASPNKSGPAGFAFRCRDSHIRGRSSGPPHLLTTRI